MALHEGMGTEHDNAKLVELSNLRDELREQCKNYILNYLTKANIDIDIQVIAERLDLASLTLVDPQDVQQGHLAKTKGFFMPRSRKATVLLEKDWYGSAEPTIPTVVHELLHSSAFNIFVSRPKYADAGLHETAIHGLKRGKKFEWLDEAVTEKLSRLICVENETLGSGSYEDEVRLLEEIIKVSGISFNAFLEAYFEEANLDAKPGERMPKWHALQKRLSSSFGPHFLQRITSVFEDEEQSRSLLEKDKNGRSKVEAMLE